MLRDENHYAQGVARAIVYSSVSPRHCPPHSGGLKKLCTADKKARLAKEMVH